MNRDRCGAPSDDPGFVSSGHVLRENVRPVLAALMCAAGINAGGPAPFEIVGSALAAETMPSRANSASAPLKQKSATETATVESLVAAAIAGNHSQLQQIVTQLKSQPKPARGDHSMARQLNERGLALSQRQRFAEAAPFFRQAHAADPGDAEIRENLGYALLKAGDVAAAQPAILAALEIGPERASAWGSLGTIYAKQGKQREAVACILTAYRFASNPRRTLDVYSRLAASDDDPKVRATMAAVVTRLSSTQ